MKIISFFFSRIEKEQNISKNFMVVSNKGMWDRCVYIFAHTHKRGLFVFLVYVCVWCTLAIIITMIFAEMLPVDWCMYAIDNRFELQERKGDLVSQFFFLLLDHHRSASIIIFLEFFFFFVSLVFYFNCMCL